MLKKELLFRSPSVINGNTINNKKLKRNLSSINRITSAINFPLNKKDQNFSPKSFFKQNAVSFKNNNQFFTNINKNNFSFKSPKNSPLSLRSSKRPESKLLLNKNKAIFENIFHRNNEKCKEENKKIQSVLSELIIWDNKQLIENNESFKGAKLFCEREKERLRTQKRYYEKSQEFNEKEVGWFFNNDGNKKINFELKFSVFDKNYDSDKIKKEEEKNKQIFTNKLENNLKKVSQKSLLLDTEKQKSKFEFLNKEQLMKIYKYIISNKLKKKKFKEIIDTAYNILNKARNECKLSVDLLRERIKSVQKYYEAYIESMNKLNKINESETRKLNDMEKYEEKINKYREYLGIYEEITKEIKCYEDKYNSVKFDLESFINEVKTKIVKLTEENNKFKYLFNELKDQQVEYYLEKLKKGEDTRNEGLSWIVKKLMELKIKIEPNLFPRFLDEEQISYIIQISKLGFECHQLKQITKKLRDKKSNLMQNKTGNIDINKFKKDLLIKDNALAEDINFDIDFRDCFDELLKEKGIINKKITLLQEKFSKKEGISPIIKYKVENKKINLITKKIKDKINIFASTKNNKLFENKEKNRDALIKCLFKEGKEKDYFQDIFLLSDRTKKLNILIYKLKNEEYSIFLEKMKLYETNENFSSKLYGKIFNALFGNSHFEVVSKNNNLSLSEDSNMI